MHAKSKGEGRMTKEKMTIDGNKQKQRTTN